MFDIASSRIITNSAKLQYKFNFSTVKYILLFLCYNWVKPNKEDYLWEALLWKTSMTVIPTESGSLLANWILELRQSKSQKQECT